MKAFIKIFCTIFCTALLTVFPSCGDDPVVNNTSQETEGPQPTETGTPNGTPVSATIGSGGGSIMMPDSSIKLTVPAGALGGNTEITIQPITNFCFNGRGNAFRFSPEGQQFSQPVTVELRYADSTLKSTMGMLMGIAYQNSAGYWRYFNDITNDTVNRVISVQLSEFSTTVRNSDGNAGGRDLSFFDLAHLEPTGARVQVNGHLNLRVKYINVTEDEELMTLPNPIGSWWVHPDPGGGQIINHYQQQATYKAPATVPTPNPVTIGARINMRYNYRGHVIEQNELRTEVTILSGDYVYDLDVNISGNFMWLSNYSCMYKDGVDLVVTIHIGTPSTVSVSNILNMFPGVDPPNGTYSNGTSSWLPETIGMTNVINGIGATYGINEDHFTLNLNHSPTTLLPKFHIVPNTGSAYDIGGTPVPGVPASVTFPITNTVQTYNFTHGLVMVYATLTPRN